MTDLSPTEARLRELGLSYPETTEAFPWGHRSLKVRGKSFAFMSNDGGVFSLSVKLTTSNLPALSQPFVEPTGYGLARTGWVTARFPAEVTPPLTLLEAWLDESFRAVAPKKLVTRLDQESG